MSTPAPSRLSIEPGGTFLSHKTLLWGYTVLVGTQQIPVESLSASADAAAQKMEEKIKELRELYEKERNK